MSRRFYLLPAPKPMPTLASPAPSRAASSAGRPVPETVCSPASIEAQASSKEPGPSSSPEDDPTPDAETPEDPVIQNEAKVDEAAPVDVVTPAVEAVSPMAPPSKNDEAEVSILDEDPAYDVGAGFAPILGVRMKNLSCHHYVPAIHRLALASSDGRFMLVDTLNNAIVFETDNLGKFLPPTSAMTVRWRV